LPACRHLDLGQGELVPDQPRQLLGGLLHQPGSGLFRHRAGGFAEHSVLVGRRAKSRPGRAAVRQFGHGYLLVGSSG
jgi:hypothetical protein